MLVDTVTAPVARKRTFVRHRAFFVSMSALLIASVFLGFAPTYYLRPASETPIPAYLHVHGAAMTTWFLLLLAQSLLIATGRRGIHRKTGVAGVLVAAIMLVLNPVVVVRSVAHGLAQGSPIQLVSLITIADFLLMAVFLVLAGLAIHWRRYPETHSRLLLLSSIAVASPALGRLALNTLGTPIPGVLGQIVFALLVVGHDLVMSRRVHPASAWGASAIIATLLFSIAMSNVQAAQAAVRLLASH